MDMFEGLEKPEETQGDIEAYRKKVRQMLGPAPTDIDDLIRAGSVPTAILFTILLELELAGLAQRHPGNKVSLV
jgi:DNA processing protein